MSPKPHVPDPQDNQEELEARRPPSSGERPADAVLPDEAPPRGAFDADDGYATDVPPA